MNKSIPGHRGSCRVIESIQLSARLEPRTPWNSLSLVVTNTIARLLYNLTANISGICPECGMTIPKEMKEKLTADPPK